MDGKGVEGWGGREGCVGRVGAEGCEMICHPSLSDGIDGVGDAGEGETEVLGSVPTIGTK